MEINFLKKKIKISNYNFILLFLLLFIFTFFSMFLYNKFIENNFLINKPIKKGISTVYNFYKDGNKVATIKQLEDFKKFFIEKYETKLSFSNKEIFLPENVKILKQYEEDYISNDNKNIYDDILKKINFLINSVEVKELDTGQTYIVSDMNVWEKTIDSINKSISGNDSIVQFKSDINYSINKTNIENSLSNQELISKIMNSKNNKYTIKEGENLSIVEKNTKFTEKEILLLNPNIEKNCLLFSNTTINIPDKDYKNKFTKVRSVTTKEPILFSYKYIYDENKYNDEKEIIQAGKNGEQTVNLNIKTTGSGEDIILSKTLLSIDKEPVTEIIIQGTKHKPHIGTGKFIWPARSKRVSTEYGEDYLFGKFRIHYGIDINDGFNADILASDNGVVLTSEYNPWYGNYVIIDHNNGYFTLYAHLNVLKAHVGQIVQAGDIIGLMGATGLATGTHLHFEVRVGSNNKYATQNPRKFIGY